MMQTPYLKHAKYLLVLFTCLLGGIYASSQVADNLQQRFTEFAGKRLQEKIYVQTDKQFFLTGEIIWFKLFVVDGSQHKPLALSKIAYVDILDRNNRPVAEAKIELESAEGKGSIYLPAQLPSGSYKLRAYTSWMKNFPADFFFHKSLTIINTQQSAQWASVDAKADYDLQFFPEGGNAIAGISSKIAFRLTDESGKGQIFQGALINERNDTVARFHPLHAGIGSFQFTPLAKQRYKALIRFADGRLLTKDFPAVEEKGYALSVNSMLNGVMNVNVESNLPEATRLFLLLHTRQQFKIMVPITLTNGKAQVQVMPENLGEGITHFTLFNHSGQPVAERLVFRLPKSKLAIRAVAGSTHFTKREKVTVNVSTSVDTLGVDAHLALSVYRLDSLQEIQESDINSYIWLSSDLKGKIESPAYYFDPKNKDAAQAVDHLMLTHGWRRFAWKEVTTAATPSFEFPLEYNGHLVTARVSDVAKSAPAAKAEAYLSVPGSEIVFSTATSNDEGILRFQTNNFHGPSEMILQVKQDNDSALRVEIQHPFSTKHGLFELPAFNLSPGLSNTLEDHHVALQVRNVFNGQQIKQLIAPAADSSSFYGKPGETYMLDAFTRFRTMEEVLREYVKFVFVRRRGPGYYLSVFDPESKKVLENDPLILIDGVPVFDYNKFMALDPLQIRKLEVVNSRYFYGNSIFDGIIHFTTYDRNIAGYELDPHVTVTNYEGLQLQREFFSPVYDSEEKVNSPVPDFRNLLFWQPELHTKGKEARELSFYTSDLPGRYAIVIEGMTAEGHFGSAVSVIEVKSH